MPVVRVDQVWLDHSNKVRCHGIRADDTADPIDLRRVGEAAGFKREFDPVSESTLAACLTHESRTRKWSNP